MLQNRWYFYVSYSGEVKDCWSGVKCQLMQNTRLDSNSKSDQRSATLTLSIPFSKVRLNMLNVKIQ